MEHLQVEHNHVLVFSRDPRMTYCAYFRLWARSDSGDRSPTRRPIGRWGIGRRPSGPWVTNGVGRGRQRGGWQRASSNLEVATLVKARQLDLYPIGMNWCACSRIFIIIIFRKMGIR